MDAYDIIKYPLSTEKVIRMMESENKLVFVVDLKSTRPEIKQAIQDTFKVKVLKVNTLIAQDGKKRAYVKLSYDTPAIDVATKLGIMG
ncbi:MAG: 50S ribosomal protein L23 [Nanoarchaeota archaeon]|nr:50S ribosomal protein L23 [Nanoarchaeota archaeon]